MFRSCSSTYESEYNLYSEYSPRYNSYCGSCNNASTSVVSKEGYTFGHFKDTYDWVECNSKKEPGQVYFYNVRSKCSTWVRPVPDDVPLQHYSHEARLYDSDCDLDDPSMVISDNEQEVDNCSVGTPAVPFDVLRGLDIVKSTDQNVLRKLYYGISIPKNSNHEFTDEGFYSGLEASNAEGVFDTLEKLPAKCIEPKRADRIPDEQADNSSEYCLAISDFLEVELQDSTQPVKIKSLKQRNSYNTSSSESEEEFKPNHYVPRLQRICTTGLITRKPTKRRKPAKPLETKRKKIAKPQPIVCNMYGTKTINYNSDYECQLDKPTPRQFKVTNLSDSSVTTTSCPRNKRAEEDLDKFLRRYRARRPEMPRINLSESSSSSSSSSDCSCCSSDSDSSGSTSSDSSSDLNSES